MSNILYKYISNIDDFVCLGLWHINNVRLSNTESYLSIYLSPKAPFSTCHWEQTSSLPCELRVNFSFPFDLGHFEYYLARLICCSLLVPFDLVAWIFETTDYGLVTPVLLFVNQNESGRHQSKTCLISLPGQRTNR